MTCINLDSNATTALSEAARRAMVVVLSGEAGNPSSIHRKGRAARCMVEGARAEVAALAGVPVEAVRFTSGATEANVAVLAMYERADSWLVTTVAEHAAVTGHFDQYAPERVRRLPVSTQGLLDPATLDAVLGEVPGPALVALQWANGETGVLQPAADLARVAHSHGSRMLLDASQAVGRVREPLGATGADYVSLSAHKLHGPAGCGALIRLSADAPAAMGNAGGGQESGLRGGTENLIGIVGFGAACAERAAALDVHIARMERLRDRLLARLQDAVPGLRVNGADAPKVPNTLNVAVPEVDGMALVAALDADGVLCSQVSACASGRPEPSATLRAMGVSEDDAFSSVRLAVSILNTEEEIDRAADLFAAAAARLGTLMRISA